MARMSAAQQGAMMAWAENRAKEQMRGKTPQDEALDRILDPLIINFALFVLTGGLILIYWLIKWNIQEWKEDKIKRAERKAEKEAKIKKQEEKDKRWATTYDWDF